MTAQYAAAFPKCQTLILPSWGIGEAKADSGRQSAVSAHTITYVGKKEGQVFTHLVVFGKCHCKA